MLYEYTLIRERIVQLEQQNEELSKRKGRKRKRIQKGGTLSFGEASWLVTIDSPTTYAGRKRPRSGGRAEDT